MGMGLEASFHVIFWLNVKLYILYLQENNMINIQMECNSSQAVSHDWETVKRSCSELDTFFGYHLLSTDATSSECNTCVFFISPATSVKTQLSSWFTNFQDIMVSDWTQVNQDIYIKCKTFVCLSPPQRLISCQSAVTWKPKIQVNNVFDHPP